RIARLSPDRVARVAIDGLDGAGKTTFADELADILRMLPRDVIRASVDGFHNPRALRYRRGRSSPEGYFEDSYNYAALKKHLLDPLSPGGSRRYRAAVFDHVTDTPVSIPEREAPASSILLFDGIFLHRPELCPYGTPRSSSRWILPSPSPDVPAATVLRPIRSPPQIVDTWKDSAYICVRVSRQKERRSQSTTTIAQDRRCEEQDT